MIEFHQQEINKLNLQLAQLTNAKTEIQASKSNGIILYCNSGTLLRDKPNGDKIAQVKRGDKVILVNSNTADWFELNYNGTIGFGLKAAFITEGEYNNILAENEKNRIEKEAAVQERIKSLKLKFGDYYTNLILTHSYEVGMTKYMIEESLGKPDKVNRTVNQFGNSEQWIYENQDLYLYFDGDKLTSYQEHK